MEFLSTALRQWMTLTGIFIIITFCVNWSHEFIQTQKVETKDGE